MKNRHIVISNKKGKVTVSVNALNGFINFLPTWEHVGEFSKDHLALIIEDALPEDIRPFLKYVPDDNIASVKFKFDAYNASDYIQSAIQLKSITGM